MRNFTPVKDKVNITEKSPLTRENFLQLIEENRQQKTELLYLRQEMEQIKRMIYGSKSERFVGQDNGQLPIEFEDLPLEEEPEVKKEQVSYTRNKPGTKKGHARLPLPDSLPRETQVIEPEFIPQGAKKIGSVVSEYLEYKPGTLYVRQIVRNKYAEPDGFTVVVAPMPTVPIPRSNVGPGFLAYLIVSKFIDHLPFHRLVKIFRRQGIDLAESTVNGWFSACSRLVEPLYQVLMSHVQRSTYIMGDETPIPVLTKDKPGSTHKGYHWVYYAPDEKSVCFDYKKTRGRDGPEEFLKDFSGTLQTDGYTVYDSFEKKGKVKLLACMAHARRKFKKALDNDPERAGIAMKKIQQLYMIERHARENNLSWEERGALRQKEAVPVLDELETWMKDTLAGGVLPKSSLGKAIGYTMNLWPRLRAYTEDGRWEIDNNPVENSIRPVALGRKNYMFAGSHDAAQRAAMMYSFLATCKINDVNPFEWLKDILTVIPDHKANRLEELLPHRWKQNKTTADSK